MELKKLLCVVAVAVSAGGWAAELRQVVIVSRHNLRAPLDTAVQDLRESTTNTWFAWTSAPGELSRKGAALETAMGGWFRDWLVEEGLFARNARLTPDQVHFFANNMQRTVATARCFAAGFMPEADVVVEHLPFDGPRDSRFTIGVPKADAALSNRVYRQIAEMMGGEGGLDRQLAPAYALLGRIIDYPSSPRGSRPGAAPFASTGVSYFDLVRPPKSIGLHGPIGEAYPVADSLILQQYEAPLEAASFGYPLSWSGWRLIGDVKEVYIDMRYRTKAMSAALGARLLPEIGGALRRDDLRLTFVGGHDTTLAWMGAQLDVEPYELPGTVECRTPIGSKIVLGRWRCDDGLDRVSVDLVYQTTAQIRAGQFADRAHPPRVVRLRLKGLDPDAEGRYPLAGVLPRLLSPDPGL
jgi:glucose-1-phosphatase